MTDGFRLMYSLEIYPGVFRRQVDRQGSAPSKDIERAAKKVRDAATGFVGTEYSGTTGRHTEPRPGLLKDSGKVVPGSGAGWVVIFDHPIANIHHNGARGHTIGSKGKRLYNPNSPVRGPNKDPRSPFDFKGQVSHPGHGGNPFLIKAANAVGLRGAGALRRGPTDTNPIFRSISLG